MSTKIFIMTHRKFDAPSDPLYIPLHVGRANSDDLGYLGDHTGENISEKNCYYSELTGLYWVAHNVSDAEYLGLCHYRRFFLDEEGQLLTQEKCEEALRECDVILPRAIYHGKSYYEVYKEAHNIKDLEVTGDVLRELYPDAYKFFRDIIASDKVYSGNLFVTSRENFLDYAKWLFSIFDVVETRINVEDYDAYHKRVFGFLSEQLLYVWVKQKGLKIYECPVGLTQEKAETMELKTKLREKTMSRSLQGIQDALTLFRKSMNERPDLMLRASDLSGELADMFRVLYVCEQELLSGGDTMLNITGDLDVLIKHYRLIETIMNKTYLGTVTQPELAYFRDAKVTKWLFGMIVNNYPSLKEEEEKLKTLLQPV